MKLIELTVRNYRIHQNLTIGFDASRNLIGGTNETGKSTIAEAIHRALFMRHRAGGDLQKAMVSKIHAGAPEVKLTFETGGETWTIEKQFAGATRSSARLRSESGASLQGDAAEDQLAELLANPDGAANRINDLSSRWSHLWVWQGTAGDDASVHAANRRDELVQRLQQQGLAAVMQSETDERVREKIRLAHEVIFTRTGGVKTGSNFDIATKSLAAADAALARASELKQKLAAAIIEQEHASKTLAESVAALPARREELDAVDAALAQANDLGIRRETELLVLQNATEKHMQIVKADQQIRDLQASAAAARTALVPAEENLSALAEQAGKARIAAELAEGAHRSLSDSVRLARQRHDLAAAWVSRFEMQAAHEALEAKSEDAASIEASLATDREELSKLPDISPAQLDKLRQLESQAAQAESALTAIAAGIELVSSSHSVLLGGQPLETGKSLVITETSELSFGDGTLLRIQPGGGTSLAESRRKLQDLRTKLTTALDQLAIPSIGEAAEIVIRRQDIKQRVSNTESRLQAMGARGLPEALANAKNALTAATADVEQRLAGLHPEDRPPCPDRIETARTLLTENRKKLGEAENLEQSVLADADATRKIHQQHQDALQIGRESLDTGRKELENFENSARVLEQNHGDANQRAAALSAAAEAESKARCTLDSTNTALSELNPERLKQECDRLNRVIANEQEKQRDAQTRIAVAKTTLSLDGSNDPDAELLQARARQAAAAEEYAREKRHADAIGLLHRLFSETQSTISERVTQPIADRVTGYLECIFGRGVRVGLDWNNPAEASIQLTRPGTPIFDFDSLSGGAKEQVAAALRLATAEILAANHDGCLPILFDDAFAYADDDRIQSLQTMLDLAANRGLQVLVLTCTPASYMGLGAKETRLAPHVWNHATPPYENPEEDETDAGTSLGTAMVSAPPPGEAEQLFIETLTAQGGSSGNQSLRNMLRWDEATYDQVKTSLVARGSIVTGRGRGGSVSLTGAT